MKRLIAAAVLAVIGLLSAACNEKTGAAPAEQGSSTAQPTTAAASERGSKYCIDLPGYLALAKTGYNDPGKTAEILSKARVLAAEAPAEVKNSWQVTITFGETHRPPID